MGKKKFVASYLQKLMKALNIIRSFQKLACQNIDIRITDFFSESKYSELKKKKLKLETEAED